MWPNLQETVDLVRFTEEILHGKLHFFCSDAVTMHQRNLQVLTTEFYKDKMDVVSLLVKKIFSRSLEKMCDLRFKIWDLRFDLENKKTVQYDNESLSFQEQKYGLLCQSP